MSGFDYDALQETLNNATPGDWIAIRNSSYWQIDPANKGEHDPWQIGDVCASASEDPDGGLQEANATLTAQSPRLAKMVLAARDLAEALEGADSAINKSFAAGSEEREGGSARRQGKLGDQIQDWQSKKDAALAAYKAAEGNG